MMMTNCNDDNEQVENISGIEKIDEFDSSSTADALEMIHLSSDPDDTTATSSSPSPTPMDTNENYKNSQDQTIEKTSKFINRQKRRFVEEINDDDSLRAMNVSAICNGEINVIRTSVLWFLAPPPRDVVKPFKCPIPSGWRMPTQERSLGQKNRGRKSLGLTRLSHDMMLSPGKSAFISVSKTDSCTLEGNQENREEEENDALAQKYIPLQVYENETGDHQVIIDTFIGKWLREHQRQGVQFLFECVSGARDYEGNGCILADDMGLGKTLQSITLIYTVLHHGLTPGSKMAQRCIVVTPTSLVRNWENEIEKWLRGRVSALALAEASREQVIKQIKMFTQTKRYQVLIISYDTFRIHSSLFKDDHACDLLICDEAHRLKNDSTQTSVALDTLKCPRRVLLSGTPMQNDLEEFFAMVNFCNPGVLGSVSRFRRHYQNPILLGREPDATEKEVKLSEERSNELSGIINKFILRRTNALLSQHLPPKLTQVVCVGMSDMQKKMYQHIIKSKLDVIAASEKEGQKSTDVSTSILASINALKKLCNHPQLLYQQQSLYCEKNTHRKKNSAYGLEDINQFFPEGFGEKSKRGQYVTSTAPSLNASNSSWSGKFLFCEKFLRMMRNETDDRIVIVSNYTQTLDLLGTMCSENQFPFVRLDGSSSAKKRQSLVDRLNNPQDDVFVFLLSSKAGGCGLNMIGANRLILFDPDWNPATDKQAAARVWRDGQKKRTYVYRLLATGSIEEKIFQRQLSKEGLQSVVADDQNMESMLSSTELRDLFSLKGDTVSDTHDKYKCERCTNVSCDAALRKAQPKALSDLTNVLETNNSPAPSRRFRVPSAGAKMRKKTELEEKSIANAVDALQIGLPNEGDLNEWSHHVGPSSADDDLLRRAGAELVTFVFGQVTNSELLALKG